MQLIIGLGNPGEQYKLTRHNAGFMALDNLLKDKNVEAAGRFSKFNGELIEIQVEGNKALLAYPKTFMNDSGLFVREAMSYYKLSPADLLIIHDEVDLPLGTIKFTDNSSAAGHNGVKSIIENIQTQTFRRIRIGIESRVERSIPPTDEFVLQRFSAEELKQIPFEAITSRIILELRAKKQ